MAREPSRVKAGRAVYLWPSHGGLTFVGASNLKGLLPQTIDRLNGLNESPVQHLYLNRLGKG